MIGHQVSFPLKIGATRAIFQLSGKDAENMEKLKISQMELQITGNAILRKLLAMPSDPNPRDFFILPRTLLTLVTSQSGSLTSFSTEELNSTEAVQNNGSTKTVTTHHNYGPGFCCHRGMLKIKHALNLAR